LRDLAKKILKNTASRNEVLLYWLGGSGYIIKNNIITIGLDIYLSNSCQKADEVYKRLVPPPLSPEDIKLDYLIASHSDGDHLDIGSLDKFISDKTDTKIIGPDSVIKRCKGLGIARERLIRLNRGEKIKINSLKLKAVFADHGEISPDCIGIIIHLSGKNIYFTSDTCYRPDLPELVNLNEKIDLLIVPINGKYNPDFKDASYIAAWVKPEIVIPTHFWMFKEHGGEPGKFVEFCSQVAPGVKILIPAIGESIYF